MYYGGRGITVCEKWQAFEGFWEDMQEGYSNKLTLDRKDNNGDYSKENCRWATQKEQLNNTRDNRLVEFNGETMTVSQLADKTGVEYAPLISRIRRGWDTNKAVTVPVTKYKAKEMILCL